MVRLQLLDAKLRSDRLSSEEVKAVAAHLVTNLPQMQQLVGLSDHSMDDGMDSRRTSLPAAELALVSELAAVSTVVELRRKSTDLLAPVQEDLLYRRGKVANSCVLVMSGKIAVLAGKDAFRSELGPWTAIAADSLMLPDGEYVPDFTAYVVSDTARILILCIHSTEASRIPTLAHRMEVLGLANQSTHVPRPLSAAERKLIASQSSMNITHCTAFAPLLPSNSLTSAQEQGLVGTGPSSSSSLSPINQNSRWVSFSLLSFPFLDNH